MTQPSVSSRSMGSGGSRTLPMDSCCRGQLLNASYREFQTYFVAEPGGSRPEPGVVPEQPERRPKPGPPAAGRSGCVVGTSRDHRFPEGTQLASVSTADGIVRVDLRNRRSKPTTWRGNNLRPVALDAAAGAADARVVITAGGNPSRSPARRPSNPRVPGHSSIRTGWFLTRPGTWSGLVRCCRWLRRAPSRRRCRGPRGRRTSDQASGDQPRPDCGGRHRPVAGGPHGPHRGRCQVAARPHHGHQRWWPWDRTGGCGWFDGASGWSDGARSRDVPLPTARRAVRVQVSRDGTRVVVGCRAR